MAKIFPDYKTSRVVFSSAAEEQFYQTCLSTLGDDWRVYYSCTLSALEEGKGLVDNEIDFVLYHPRLGLIVIEVKGGQIGFNAERGEFISTNRHGQSFTIKNPFQQVLSWKSRFLRYLRREGLRLPVTHAVCFPGVQESEFPSSVGVETKLILGQSSLRHLEAALTDLVKACQPGRFLEFVDQSQPLDEILRGRQFLTKLNIREYIDHHEQKVKSIETIHESLVLPIAGAKRLGIEGAAGTGKTMLATLLARHFHRIGQSVLFISSNTLLTTQLRTEMPSEITVYSYPELATRFGGALVKPDAAAILAAATAASERYDVIICDEAQDVEPLWWAAVEALFRGTSEDRLYAFFDRSQGVFGSTESDISFTPEDVLPVSEPYFPLVHNYRNTREISEFAHVFRTGKKILSGHSTRLGYVPEIVTYLDAADCRRKLATLADQLLAREGLRAEELHLLSARRPLAPDSVLYGESSIGAYKLLDLGARKSKRLPGLKELQGHLSISTIGRFKGLETGVGILLNLSEYQMAVTNPLMLSLIYVAATRARHMLYIFVQAGDPKEAFLRQALGAISKPTGAVVIDATAADGEYQGTVVEYQPERLGWLQVADTQGGIAKIMFFPADLGRSVRTEVKVGSVLRFRPQLEGHLTIAGNLQLA